MRTRVMVDADRAWVEQLLGDLVGGRWQARRTELVDVMAFPGLVAEDDHRRQVGYVSYRVEEGECELLAIAATRPQAGVGTALLKAVRREVETTARCVWVVTTNDNLDALRFYQRRGFRLRALRPGAVDESRRTIKTSISETGAFGIPLRDELELELRLD